MDADRALAGARAQRAAGLDNWCCFLAEQAAQLAVKGLLHGLGAGPRGHDLVALATRLREEGVEVDEEVSQALRRLGRFYIATRYPDAHPEGGAAPHYGESDALSALRDAEDVLGFVDRAWKEING